MAENGIKWDLGDMGEGEGAPTIKRGVTVTRICGATEHPVSVYPLGQCNGGKELMKERDIKIILTFNRTQVRSLSTVVTNLDDPAYLNYPDHYDHLTTCRTTWTTLTNALTMNTWITLPTWTTLTACRTAWFICWQTWNLSKNLHDPIFR